MALTMSRTSIRPTDIRCKLALPLARGWPGVLDHLSGSRVQRRGQMLTECFGGLNDKDEAVVRGLAAGLACSTERGHDRW
jgi:hypothetical protein